MKQPEVGDNGSRLRSFRTDTAADWIIVHELKLNKHIFATEVLSPQSVSILSVWKVVSVGKGVCVCSNEKERERAREKETEKLRLRVCV